MKYKVFMGYYYYPKGGYDDFFGSFKNLQEAKEFILTDREKFYEWAHIVVGNKIFCKFKNNRAWTNVINWEVHEEEEIV